MRGVCDYGKSVVQRSELACWGAGTVNEGGSSTHQGQSMPPVLQQSQSITFTSSPPIPAFPGGSYTVTATGGSSSDPVWFSSITPAVCTFGESAGNASIL